ncbi:MAG: FAD:protein FMN transferase [Rhodocyclaceae bacterium]|nr:FAD:protein FMN transferase [Rhodocyclaceae bacterium]
MSVRHLLLVLMIPLLLSGCSRERTYAQESYVFGTRVEVVVFGRDEHGAHEALAAVLRDFDRMHRAYHAWEPSELTALNAAIADGRPMEVSEELAAMLTDAQRLSALGEGLFDPGIGRLIELWGFHTDTFRPKLPEEGAIQALLARHPGIRDLEIDGRRVSSRNRLVQLDLGGYAKGYALDRANTLLRGMGIRNALINIGGNVMALGAHGDRPWRIGIQHPRDGGVLASMPLYDGEAVGTSGDYQRYFEVDGVRYCHLLDPRSGRPSRETRSLSVLVTPRPGAGTLSDVASKPLFIGGSDWRALARRYGVGNVLRVDASGRIEVTRELDRRLEYHGDTVADSVVD